MSGDERSELALLRIDLQQLAKRQADDARNLHGRFKGVDQKHDALAVSVGDLKVESAKQTQQLAYLVAAEEKREAEKVMADELQVALTKHKSERKGTLLKIILGVLGILGTLVGVAAAAH